MHRSGHEGYRIQPATPADAPTIGRLHVDGWRSAYPEILPPAFLESLSYPQREEQWRQVLESPEGRHVLLAREHAGPVVGFACVGPAAERDRRFPAELSALYVQVSHQRQGVGTGLFRAAAESAIADGRDAWIVWVLSGTPASRFLEHLGGARGDERTLEIAGASVDEVSYTWSDLRAVLRPADRD